MIWPLYYIFPWLHTFYFYIVLSHSLLRQGVVASLVRTILLEIHFTGSPSTGITGPLLLNIMKITSCFENKSLDTQSEIKSPNISQFLGLLN